MRVDKFNFYLNLAEDCARRGTCLRRNYGAVIVKNDEVISTGYTGSARNTTNCTDRGTCKRNDLGCKPGEHYEYCRSVHAEANAVISAARRDMLGGTLFLVGIDAVTGRVLDVAEPCAMCRRLLLNAGIKTVVGRSGDTGEYTVTDTLSYALFDE